MDFDFSIHAVAQMTVRGISFAEVSNILLNPHQVIRESEIFGIDIYQSIFKNLKG